MTPSSLEQLRQLSTVVADTSDFDSIRQYSAIDATTNPSLVLQATKKPEYAALLRHIVDEVRHGPENGRSDLLVDTIFVRFGQELLKIVPGRVSTEVDAALSFDTKKSIDRAIQLISLYERGGTPRERVLIKLAATWEGIQAAKVLESRGIHCNMTLIFSLVQAAACADAGATLISPFVGRVLDWSLKNGRAMSGDPGVAFVQKIYAYYKKFGVSTAIMGASFRNLEEITSLAGCDLLTIAPKFLAELAASSRAVPRRLFPRETQSAELQPIQLDEPRFRFLLNEDAMATEKLAEGLRLFSKDTKELLSGLSSLF